MKTHRHSAFTLFEMLIVVTIVGIMAAVLLPSSEPSIYHNLQGAAEIMAADVAYARSLAVTNNSRYRITFDATNNRYTLTHTGTNTALNTLPSTPFRAASDTATQQVVSFDALPRMGIPVKFVAAHALASFIQNLTSVEFMPHGGTLRSEEAVIWLSAGEGTAKRYLSIRISPVTGLTWIEKYQAAVPPAIGSARTYP